MQGRIRRVIRGKGFGFILAEDRQYFFHHTEVRNFPFKRLVAGDVVEFQAFEEDQGGNPRAADIVVVSKRERLPKRAASSGAARGPSGAAGPRAGSPSRGNPPGGVGDLGEGGNGPVQPGAPDPNDPDYDPEFVEDLEPVTAGPATREPSVSRSGTPDGRGSSRPPGPPRRSGSTVPSGSGRARPARRDGASRVDRGPGRPSARSPGRDLRRDAGRELGREAGRPPVQLRRIAQRAQGIVRAIDLERGFGIIRSPDGDIFFDRASARGSFDGLSVGSLVTFTMEPGGARPRAETVMPS